MKRRNLFTTVGACVACISATTLGVAAGTNSLASAASRSAANKVTFSSPYGVVQTFSVPSGIRTLKVTLVAGGGGGSGGFTNTPTAGSPGASGEKVTATVTVRAGTPSISVVTGAGGMGGPGEPVVDGAVGGMGGVGSGNGGQGGPLTFPGSSFYSYGGGGGGSGFDSPASSVCTVKSTTTTTANNGGAGGTSGGTAGLSGGNGSVTFSW